MKPYGNKLNNFIKALHKLEEGLLQYDGKNELLRDGLIQRFEFTFKLAWKTLKEVFEEEQKNNFEQFYNDLKSGNLTDRIIEYKEVNS